jgi:hypothetical protein
MLVALPALKIRGFRATDLYEIQKAQQRVLPVTDDLMSAINH